MSGTDPLVVPPPPPDPVKADVLFVVDNSGGSVRFHTRLIDAFPRFLAAVEPADLRVGVVSTDTTNEYEREGVQRFEHMDEYPWMLTDFTAEGCRATTFERGCARRIIDTSRQSRDVVIDEFRAGITSVGNCGSGNELPLRAALAAIDRRLDCNRELFRDEAMLLVVWVHDDEDVERTPLEEIQAGFAERKDQRMLRMGAIMGAVEGTASDCGIGVGSACGSLCENELPRGSMAPCTADSQCDGGDACINWACDNPHLRYWNLCFHCSFYSAPDCCAAIAGTRNVDFLRAFEAASGNPVAIESICEPDLGDAMERMAGLLR